MSSISSLTKAVSGLVAAQKGLQVTGHNISNTNTDGYTRQQLLQSDSRYLTVGKNGGYSMQVGLGVTQDEIRQIRDELADKRLRTENSVLCYYQKLNAAVSDIESIFDEPYGSTVSDLINDFWSQTQKLSTNPDGVEERMSFISTAKVLISKVNVVTDSLTTHQQKLDNDVKASVNRINEILEGIKEYNDKISIEVATGENANDYRDQRNLLLDELSQYGEINYYEEADRRVVVKFEGHVVVNKGLVNKMELEQTEVGSPFSSPIWADTKSRVYKLDERSSSTLANDTGSLKALLIARGNNIVTGTTKWEDVALNNNFSVDVEGNAFVIPKVQKMLNEFTTTLVGMVNDSFTGTGIGAHEGIDGVPVFVPITISNENKQKMTNLAAAKDAKEVALKQAKVELEEAKKINGNVVAAEAEVARAQEEVEKAEKAYKEFRASILIAGNVQVNPELLESGGYNKLGTVSKGDGTTDNSANIGDNSIVKDFLSAFGATQVWNEAGNEVTAPYQKTSTMTDFFSELVTDLGTQSSLYTSKVSEKNISVTNIENERQAMSGVSTDEEFSNMLKYQYAYNASARMITMLDGMLDTIINRM